MSFSLVLSLDFLPSKKSSKMLASKLLRLKMASIQVFIFFLICFNIHDGSSILLRISSLLTAYLGDHQYQLITPSFFFLLLLQMTRSCFHKRTRSTNQSSSVFFLIPSCLINFAHQISFIHQMLLCYQGT